MGTLKNFSILECKPVKVLVVDISMIYGSHHFENSKNLHDLFLKYV